jgi:hypothetical protein
MPFPAAQANMFCLISPGSGSAAGERRSLTLPSPKERVLKCNCSEVLSFGEDYFMRASPFR